MRFDAGTEAGHLAGSGQLASNLSPQRTLGLRELPLSGGGAKDLRRRARRERVRKLLVRQLGGAGRFARRIGSSVTPPVRPSTRHVQRDDGHRVALFGGGQALLNQI